MCVCVCDDETMSMCDGHIKVSMYDEINSLRMTNRYGCVMMKIYKCLFVCNDDIRVWVMMTYICVR